MSSSPKTRFPERQVIQLLLVRAAEEHQPSVFTGEQIAAATAAALRASDDLDVLAKRSAYLYLRLPRALSGLAHAALLPENLIGACLGLAVLTGMLSNYLGPSGSIHVAYNPLTLLLVWNVLVLTAYGWTAIRSLRRLAVAPAPSDSQRGNRGKKSLEGTPSDVASNSDVEAAADQPQPGRVNRWLTLRLYLRWRAWWAKYEGTKASVQGAGTIAANFLQSYREAAAPILSARIATLMHVGAIGMLIGALAGTYLRGMFLEYNAVWRSTFLLDLQGVTTFLNALLGPASLLQSGALLSTADVAPLLNPAGSPAGPWIHLLAITLGVFVIPLRTVLAAMAARRAKVASSGIAIDVDDAYYSGCIHSVRDGLGLRLREGVSTAFTLEVAKLSESVSLFVCERFFDKSVAPILVGFRNRGGRILDLEAELKVATEEFAPSLQEHLAGGQRELQRALAEEVRQVIGREFQLPPEALASSSTAALPLEQSVTGPLASGFGDAIGATVTTAVAAAVATVSGGLGKTLGIAVLSSLLGTSGPIGLLIGGVSAAALVGGAYIFGRDQISETIKGWSIPASLISLALRDSKIVEARKATYAQVRREVEDGLKPRVEEVTKAILAELPVRVPGGQADTSHA